MLALGSNVEGVDLGPLLGVNIPVHCAPPATLCLPLLALGLLQLCRHPWSGGAVGGVTSDERGVLLQNFAEVTVVVFHSR